MTTTMTIVMMVVVLRRCQRSRVVDQREDASRV